MSETPKAPAQTGTFTDKTGWRRKAFKRPDPEPEEADTAANDNATEGATEGASEGMPPDPDSDDDVVLDEQDLDEADVAAFVDRLDAGPNER